LWRFSAKGIPRASYVHLQCTHRNTHTYTHIHTQTYTHARTHTHTYTHILTNTTTYNVSRDTLFPWGPQMGSAE